MDSSRAVRGFVAVILVLLAGRTLAAGAADEKQSLKSRHQIGEVSRVEVALQVGGELKLVNDGQTKTLPMSVVANLKYDERLLALEGERPSRSARYYDDTRAVIKVEKGGEKPSLGPFHRLIVAEKTGQSSPTLYCPTEPLAREELDLIDVQGNSLLVDRLLPEAPVALGDSWKLTDGVLADLLGLEAVSWSDVSAVLGQITDGVAEIAAAGTINGAVGGVATEIELKAKYRFDMQQARISFVALLVKEKRAVGHVGPGLDTVAKLIMTITPKSASENLTAVVLAQVPKKLTEEVSALGYAAASGQFRFQHDRRWYLTSDDAKLTVLRLLDRGELVAQCNISLLHGGKKTPVTLAEFQQDVQHSLAKNFGQFVHASQSTSEAGYSVLRVVAHGTVSQLPIEWVYYLIQDPQGKRLTLAFTYEQSLTERFGQADRALVAKLRMTEPPAPTAARPSVQQ